MAKITTILNIGLSFRRPEEIAEVKKLRNELDDEWQHTTIYIAGLRAIAALQQKAKNIVPEGGAQ